MTDAGKIHRHYSGMHDSNTKRPLTLGPMARRLRVPSSWLRSEAEAGRIPHLKAGKTLLFDAETVEGIVLERVRQAGAREKHNG